MELTSSQKAVMALKVEENLAEEFRTRQLAGLRNQLVNENESSSTNQLVNENESSSTNSSIKEQATKKAAEVVGVNHQYVSDAKRIKRHAPELLIFILDGLITIPQAKKLADLPPHQRSAIVEQVKSGALKNITFAIQQLPEEEELPTKFSSGWRESMSKLRIFFLGLRDHGGIAKLSRRWNRADKRAYLAELRQVRDLMNECIKHFEKELSK